MNYRINRNLFILLGVAILSCKTPELKNKDLPEFDIQKIEENYREYTYLETNIVVQGNIEKNNFSYPGKIKVFVNEESGDIKINFSITDPIFLSPLFKLELVNNDLYYKDILQNREERSVYKGSGIYFLSSHMVPSEILLPLFIGQIPVNLLKQSRVDKNGILVQKTDEYILTAFLEDNKFTSYTLKNRENQDPVVIQLEGMKTNDLKRYFPEKLKVIFPNKESFEIHYKKISIK